MTEIYQLTYGVNVIDMQTLTTLTISMPKTSANFFVAWLFVMLSFTIVWIIHFIIKICKLIKFYYKEKNDRDTSNNR